jgi:Transcriptional regulator PadR-like family
MRKDLRIHGGRRTVRDLAQLFGAKTESNVVQKTAERPGWERGLSGLSYYCFVTIACDATIQCCALHEIGTEASTSALGFAVSQRLRQMTGDVLQVSDGSLYPALHKLETL